MKKLGTTDHMELLSRRSCPLGHEYDADAHDAIAHLRILDGSLAPLKAWQLSQLFCPSRGSEILGVAQLASVWVFLLLHA